MRRFFMHLGAHVHDCNTLVGTRIGRKYKLSAYDFNQENAGKPLLFEGGSWKDIEQPLRLLTEYALDDTWSKLLQRSGYELEAAKFGGSDAFRFDVHRARVEAGKQKAQHKYFVNVEMGTGQCQHIFVDNFRSLVQLLDQLASIASAGRVFE